MVKNPAHAGDSRDMGLIPGSRRCPRGEHGQTCLENPYLGSIGAQYATGDQWRNHSRKNEGMEPKQKQYPVDCITSECDLW